WRPARERPGRTRMARLRTFIAVDIGPQVRGRVVALQDELAEAGADVKWVEPENLHVTLLFLGEVADREIPDVCRAVADVCRGHAGFAMSVEKFSCFGNPRRPRTLWVGVGTGAQELVAVHDAIEAALMKLGCYRREERSFTPHVTIGRVKSDRPNEALAAALAKKAGWKGGTVPVQEVLGMSSELRRDGPESTVLSRAPLK